MYADEDFAVIRQLTQQILGQHLPSHTKAALIDFPRHQNAGDSLIWLGERAHLATLGVELGFVAGLHHFDADELRARVPEGPILLHGGGNFGDRWPRHQEFREYLVAEFPDRKIIQLPQSFDFTDAGVLERASRAYCNHPDLVLLMRDHQATEQAREAFPQNLVEFCPDSALGVTGLQDHTPREPSKDVVLLLRDDVEAAGHNFTLSNPSQWRGDWGLTGWRNLAYAALRMPENVARVFPAAIGPLYPTIASSFDRMAWLNVKAAKRRVTTGRVLVTDRLHAAILGALCGVPVIALDNAYGKLSRIHADYLSSSSFIYLAADATEAHRELVDRLNGA